MAVRRVAERQSTINARAAVENLLHGSNDPLMFSALEKLRMEWAKQDAEPAPMVVSFDIQEFDDGWYWFATAANGEVVATVRGRRVRQPEQRTAELSIVSSSS